MYILFEWLTAIIILRTVFNPPTCQQQHTSPDPCRHTLRVVNPVQPHCVTVYTLGDGPVTSSRFV